MGGICRGLPGCQQPFTVPSMPAVSMVNAIPRPFAKTSSQIPRSASRRSSGPMRRSPRGGGGFGRFLMVLIAVAVAGFGYMMVRFNESPQQVWKRLTDSLDGMTRAAAPSTPMPSTTTKPALESMPEVAPLPSSVPDTAKEKIAVPVETAKPVDPLIWLLEHKERAPKEIILQHPAKLWFSVKGRKLAL